MVQFTSRGTTQLWQKWRGLLRLLLGSLNFADAGADSVLERSPAPFNGDMAADWAARLANPFVPDVVLGFLGRRHWRYGSTNLCYSSAGVFRIKPLEVVERFGYRPY
jgi:hypothetical protein